MISAVIFDFDGVLADTEPLHLAAFADVFAARGWTLDQAAYYDRYLGFDDRGLVRAYAADHQIPLDVAEVERLVGAKTLAFARFLKTGNLLYPGAVACVAALATRFRLAIASGALRNEIAAVLKAGGLLDAFPVIVGADDVQDTKPSPVPYLAAAARLGVMPGECVAIEDSRAGLTSARTAGMRTIALPTTSPRHVLGSADRILDGLGDLTPELIAGLERESGP